MLVSVRQVSIDDRPVIGLMIDRSIIIPLDKGDTIKLIKDLQRELRKLIDT